MVLLDRLAPAAALALCFAGAVEAASLADRPSTLVFSGTTGYEVSIANGDVFTVGGVIDGGLDFFASAFFDPGTQGANPVNEDLSVLDPLGAAVLNARGVAGLEIGAGFLAVLFDDLLGDAADQFAGGLLLAIFRDGDFPALAGEATVELRSLNDLTAIPLPAAAPLLLAAFAALGFSRRRRR